MADRSDEVEAAIFQALAHPMRRRIIKILGSEPRGLLYTELITELGLSTGKLNYHLEQLQGVIEKNEARRYVLSTLGNKALNQLRIVEHEITAEDEKYLRLTQKAQKASIEPTLSLFIITGLAASVFILAVLLTLAHVAMTESVPPVIYVLLPFLIAIEVGLIATLVHALRRAPEWLRRIERRFLDPT